MWRPLAGGVTKAGVDIRLVKRNDIFELVAVFISYFLYEPFKIAQISFFGEATLICEPRRHGPVPDI